MLLSLALLIAAKEPVTFRQVELPNQALAVAQRVEKQPLVSIQVFASAIYAPEIPATYGVRHLLEHLLAYGSSGGQSEIALERAGGFLRAQTSRDVIQFEINVPKQGLEEGMRTLKDVLQLGNVTQERIRQEAKTIEEEKNLSDSSTRLGAAAWQALYGADGLDPMGDPKLLSTLTPDDVRATYAATFNGACLVAVVAGDIDVEATIAQLKTLLKGFPAKRTPRGRIREAKTPQRIEIEGFGEARAVAVPDFNDMDSAAAVAAALGIASEIDDCFFLYTPSASNGVVTVGRAELSSGFGLAVDAMSRPDFLTIYNRSRNLARAWFRRQIATPAASAQLYGSLLSQDRNVRPERFSELIDALDPDRFVAACERFQKKSAAIVVGVP